jgi:hypothetical protein
MTEDIKNIYDTYEFPQDFKPQFSNVHAVSHSAREFFLTFGVMHPPRIKPSSVSQIIMTKEHVVELILNLQTQLKKFNEETGGDKSNPSSRI